MTGGSGGLTAGSTYYLDAVDGKLTATAPSVTIRRPVGIALSTTEMLLVLHEFDALSDAVSVGTATANALSNAISILSVQLSLQISVLSQQVSALSNAVSVLSQQVSALSQVVSVISQQLSVLSAGLGGMQMRVVGNVQGLSSITFANVSGLSASVASAAVYEIQGIVMYQMSVAPTIVAWTVTFPAGCTVAGRLDGNISVGNTGLSVTGGNAAFFDGAASGSAILSIVPASTSTFAVYIDGLFQVSTTAGTIQIQARTSATTQPINIQRGSYLRAYKLL